MARYHATVESRRSTMGMVVTGEDGSMVGYQAEVRPRGPLQALDAGLRSGDAS
jgi:hypothetical protein